MRLTMKRNAVEEEWIGDTPMVCDICKNPITDQFIDGRTTLGPWAIMCPTCHPSHGVGLGFGRGQKYHRLGEGEVFIRLDE